MKREAYDNGIDGTASVPLTKKLRGRGGFTLAETLLAVLILLLVSVVVATGMPAVTNAYNKVILGANAKVMLSTAITALHDEIGTAWEVKEIDGGLSYFNASTGAKSELSLDDGKSIQIQDYLSQSDDLIHGTDYTPGEPRHLVPDATSRMYVTYTGISYDNANGIVTITGLKVCKESDDSTDETTLVEYTGESGCTIRVISKDAA